MSRIRSKDTGPERQVRSILHSLGCRFRVKKRARLPGTPDVVLRRHRSVILVHGCFWHRHPRCKEASTPKSNVDKWTDKFAKNTARDRRTDRALRTLGWRVIVVWECELSRPGKLRRRLAKLLQRPLS
jgi:DNA mismatch endonuclease (patch repair protein)